MEIRIENGVRASTMTGLFLPMKKGFILRNELYNDLTESVVIAAAMAIYHSPKKRQLRHVSKNKSCGSRIK